MKQSFRKLIESIASHLNKKMHFIKCNFIQFCSILDKVVATEGVRSVKMNRYQFFIEKQLLLNLSLQKHL